MKYSEAAKQLQAAVGTTQDGKIGDKTLEAWNKLIASVKGNPATKSFKIKNEAVMIAYLAEIKKAKTLAAAAKAAADKFASYK
jgi:lysozyme family protein